MLKRLSKIANGLLIASLILCASHGYAQVIPQTGWTLVLVDSQETVKGAHDGAKAFDGNPSTMWHTRWSGIEPDPPPPHEIQVNLGAVYDINGFRYLPRQDFVNGRIAQYEFSVSSVLNPDETVNWETTVVATGTFPNTTSEQQVLFTPKTGQYVRLRALSEVNGGPWTSVAELNVLASGNLPPDGVINSPATNLTIVAGDTVNFTGTASDPDSNLPLSFLWTFEAGSGIADATSEDPGLIQFNNPGTFTVTFTVTDALGLPDPTPATRTITVLNGSGGVIPQTGWTLVLVDSQETVKGAHDGAKAFDGNPSTMWHTRWSGIEPDPPPPHEIQVNLGAVYDINGFRYLPRQDFVNGRIAQYEFSVSSVLNPDETVNWETTVVATGTFVNDATEKQVLFTAKSGQYVRLRALTEVNGNPWTSAAELNVLGSLSSAPAGTLQFSAATYSVAENVAGGNATITVTRTGGSAGAVGVSFATSNGTASAGSDYTAVSQTVNFAAGDTADKTVNVPITDDTSFEPDETVTLTLSAPTGGATLGSPSTAVLTITENDPAPPAGTLQFSAATYSVAENVAGGNATITVTRTGGSAGAVGVSFATSNGTASAGSDYTAVSQTVNFAAGDTADKTVNVPITDDTSFEPDETVTLTLSAPTGGATLGSPSTAVLTITENDPAPAITSINPTSGPVGTSVTINGSNFGSTKETSTVTFNGTAATPTSWSTTSIIVPVPAGATTGLVVVTVSGLASNGVTFTVTIPKIGWTLLFVDSQETVGENGAATNSFDGNAGTHWHTRYAGIEPDPPPHEIQINLGAVYNVSGFRYLPRQDGASNGRIAQYEFYVSSDPANWGGAVATGTFANTGVEKQVLFSPKMGQYIRLRALSEVNGKPWTSMAELNLLQSGTGANQVPDGVIDSPAANSTIIVGSAISFTGTGSDPDGSLPLSYRWSFGPGSGIPDITVEDPGLVQFNTPGTFIVTFTVADSLGLVDPTPATRTITVQSGSSGVAILQTNWTLLFVDSQEVVAGSHAGTKAFDGNLSTFWHTQWANISPDPPPPHEIRINLGAVYDIGGFRYLPRQDLSNGRIAQYEFYVSLDDVNWGSPVATGTFPNTTTEQEVPFIPKPGQYVRLRALSEVLGRAWTSVAELNVLQAACMTPSVTLIQPQSYYLQTSTALDVVADACLASGQGVRLMIDGGSVNPPIDDYTAPYEFIFTGLAQSEHVVDAFVIDATGTPVAGIATHDQAIQVGIGDYYVAMGDSITEGYGDNIPSDDSSQDGRNTDGGYTPILDDILTAAKGHPHTVVNEGVGGARSSGGLSLIPTLLQKHPNAQRFLIMYGTNDAGGIPVPSGLGLSPGSPGYPGSFKDNMQRIINAIIDPINGAGKLAILAKAPVTIPLTGQRNQMIEQYNLVIDELVAANSLIPPPDMHSYFEINFPTEYWDAIHPNGFGYQSMGNLWNLALP